MLKSKMRLLGASALVGAGLLAAAPAEAYNLRLGDVDVQIDTTVSFGASFVAADRETRLLPSSNGGPLDTSAYRDAGPDGLGCGTADAIASTGAVYGAYCSLYGDDVEDYNYDSSINTDDGRLNFDNGDLISAPLKITSDIEARISPSVTAFARIKGFYDAVLADDGSYERAAPGVMEDDMDHQVIQHLDLLDAYVSWDTELFGQPLLVRAGKQVINWGESTFVLGGNSAFNPIDVGAIRKPGSEIKEALLPVEAIYASISLPYDVSVEAYYGWWDDYKLDVGGTFFANGDITNLGSGGNQRAAFVGGGLGSGSSKFPCESTGVADMPAASQAMRTALLGVDGAVDCDNNGQGVFDKFTIGQAEIERRAYGDTNQWKFGEKRDPEDDGGGWGLAVRWYSEALNSTEFGAYYQKYYSRTPYVVGTSGTATADYTTVGANASTTTRGAGLAGCAGYATSAALAAAAEPITDSTTQPVMYNPGRASVGVTDPKGILPEMRALRDASGAGSLQQQVDLALTVLSQGAILGYTPSAPAGTVAELNEIQCMMNFANAGYTAAVQGGAQALLGTTIGNGDTVDHVAAPFIGWLPTGSMAIVPNYNIGLDFEYPEIEVIGLSAATTVLGWGVQGEIAYRPDMKLNNDSDAIAIASIVTGCGFSVAAAFEGAYIDSATYQSIEGDELRCRQSAEHIGYQEHDTYNWDIGTTATFTRSNPVVSFFGADLAILLTEFAGVYAPTTDEATEVGVTYAADKVPLAGICTSGSDLPLGSVFSLDPRDKAECRPTESSYGMVLFGQLQYNNAFGTPVNLKPTLIYSEGLEGYSPTPVGFWREGNSTLGLRLDADYQGRWTASVGYTVYDGDVLVNRNVDKDNFSISASYAF